jgi:hypothetical protein
MDHNSLGLHRRSLSDGEGDDGSEMIAPGYFHKHQVMATLEEMRE